MEKQVLELAVEALKYAAQVVQYLAAPAVGWALWYVRGIRRDQADFGQRLVRLEFDHAGLKKCVDDRPSGVAIKELAGDIKAVREIVERVERMVNRHEDHLLGGGR
ncbi:hypothetical protein Deba_1592 [Desulfarculus baarsii DSM 2075]|uniref:Uncharacterized protein n=1 Tax=Desulfarculus baarsii (strain ATCC 33931 / DSM 2075 / LMG 7858 / VKM B-1802 / 2st14) TaxID=644282 RepID=E1QHB7_DESB2|nr:hypothetical protein [Desulfarculus baarsii]ADK84960.1 hypothetical protein Deba_1592 [Desulfarculus baarsii DSM 2075]